MLLPYLSVINKKNVILGSQSKSRNQLMSTQQLKYERVPSKFAQDLDKKSFQTASEYNMETCRGKAKDLEDTFKAQNKQWDLLICGDTIAEFNEEIIEKPEDEKHCIEMVRTLSSNTHRIYTAHVVVFNTEPKIRYEWVTRAEVTFGDISLQIAQEFAKLPEPYLHSGAYELTAASGSFIKEVKGSHTAVQGLDIYELCSRIVEGSRKAGWIA